MKQQAFIYKTSGEILSVLPENGIEFTLSEMQKFVNGSIELVRLSDNRFMVVNEEGKIFDLEENVSATKLYHIEYGHSDYICGDVLVTPAVYIK